MRDYKQECDKFEAANKILQQRENEVKNKEDELKKHQSKILKDKEKLELKKRAVLLVVHLKNLMLFPFDASFHISHRTIKLSLHECSFVFHVSLRGCLTANNWSKIVTRPKKNQRI